MPGTESPPCSPRLARGPLWPVRLRFRSIYVRLEAMKVLATGLACPLAHCPTLLGRGNVVSGNNASTLGLLSLLLAIGCRA